MPFGYNGRIARINLTTKDVSFEELDELIYRMYLGGRGLAAYILFSEMKKAWTPSVRITS